MERRTFLKTAAVAGVSLVIPSELRGEKSAVPGDPGMTRLFDKFYGVRLNYDRYSENVQMRAEAFVYAQKRNDKKVLGLGISAQGWSKTNWTNVEKRLPVTSRYVDIPSFLDFYFISPKDVGIQAIMQSATIAPSLESVNLVPFEASKLKTSVEVEGKVLRYLLNLVDGGNLEKAVEDVYDFLKKGGEKRQKKSDEKMREIFENQKVYNIPNQVVDSYTAPIMVVRTIGVGVDTADYKEEEIPFIFLARRINIRKGSEDRLGTGGLENLIVSFKIKK